ncbi:MAG: hypothetical protein HF973_09440 [Chloroflexi bacterium]|nr:hypothetical protein [Chloroflexota bacterium]
METRQIIHVESGETLIPQARWCAGFGAKLRGFTFRRQLAPDDGLVLVEKSDSKMSTSIHMFFVFFDLGVIWVNDAGEVVGTALAKPWRPSYVPPGPARYVIEGHPAVLDKVQAGDHIRFAAPVAAG